MKKLKLNLQNIEGAELLTREQLKTVMGGSGSGNPVCLGSTSKCRAGESGTEEGVCGQISERCVCIVGPNDFWPDTECSSVA